MHLYAGEQFYPGAGSDCNEKHDEATGKGSNICNVALTPVGPGPGDKAARARMSIAQRAAACESASAEMKRKMTATMFPALREFAPDLLIISSGFDAHYDDM